MTNINDFKTAIVLFGVVVLLGLAALTMLEQAQAVILPVMRQQSLAAAEVIEWAEVEQRITLPPDLGISDHAVKHVGQHLSAWTIYAAIMQGECIRTAIYCGPSDVEFLILCEIPSGRVGGLILLADEILTGYEGKLHYWESVVNRDRWEVCRD